MLLLMIRIQIFASAVATNYLYSNIEITLEVNPGTVEAHGKELPIEDYAYLKF